MIHVYLWLAWIMLNFVQEYTKTPPTASVVARDVLMLGVLIPPVYVHFFLFDRLYAKRRYVLYALSTVAVIVLFASLNRRIYVEFLGLEYGTLRLSISIIYFVLISTSLRLARKEYEQRLSLKEMRITKHRIEMELLKSQINPHFLFNTLNNLYGMAGRVDRRLARAIHSLSGLMRYVIVEGKRDSVELEKELAQIDRYVELQRLRFSGRDDIAIRTSTSGPTAGLMIPPMLLYPFVENAFKHGINLNHHSFVDISVRSENHRLCFCVRNSDHAREQKALSESNGIGLSNVRRRLQLLRPGEHELDIRRGDGVFSVRLSTRLEDKDEDIAMRRDR